MILGLLLNNVTRTIREVHSTHLLFGLAVPFSAPRKAKIRRVCFYHEAIQRNKLNLRVQSGADRANNVNIDRQAPYGKGGQRRSRPSVPHASELDTRNVTSALMCCRMCTTQHRQHKGAATLINRGEECILM